MDRELDIQVVWEPFVWLQATLRLWAMQLTDLDTAKRIARLACTDVARLALCAYYTPQGPLAFAIEQAQYHLSGFAKAKGTWDAYWAPSPKLSPTDEQLQRLCAAYAAFYEAGYLGDWDKGDIEAIMMLISTYDAVGMDSNRLVSHLHNEGRAASALRCAFSAIAEHEGGSMLVCAAASDLRDHELSKSRAWARDLAA